MKIGYFADGPWSHKALDKIFECEKLQVVFIVGRFDQNDVVLKEYANRKQIPFFVNKNVNSREFIDQIKKYSADLFVSMSFNQILRRGIIGAAPLGFINCHAGSLPFYRGRNVLNWALINGENKLGVTVIDVDDGIDTGDIITQNFCEISKSDNYATLLEKAYDLCADSLFEALISFEKNEVCRIRQDSIHPVGSYFPRRIQGDEFLDWNWESERIYNFIRAITYPGPCARMWLNDKELAVVSAQLIDNAPKYIALPGEVVGRDSEGIIVKTGDSTLRILQIADIDSTGLTMGAVLPNYAIGTRFGINVWSRLKLLEARVEQLENHNLKSVQ